MRIIFIVAAIVLAVLGIIASAFDSGQLWSTWWWYTWLLGSWLAFVVDLVLGSYVVVPTRRRE
jgi:branched-subunit amino acid permease